MTQEHPIIPPPELVHQWHKVACKDPYNGGTFFGSKVLKSIATQAARWGADTELDACCECINDLAHGADVILADLRAARRPKPPSLKEQALFAIDTAVADGRLSSDVSNVVRRALEALPND